MANEVIIEFKADTRGLESALKLLESTGQIDKKLADQIRNDNKAWKEREEAIKKSNQEQAKAADPKMQPRVSQESINSFVSLKGAMLEVGKAASAAFAVSEIIRFGRESVKAAAEAEKGELRLLTALKNRESIQKSLIAQANQLEKVSGVDDKAIIRQQTFLALQGRSEAQIKRTIEASIRLSKVTGTDLETAVQQLDGTLEGNIGRLGKLDSGFEKLTQAQLANGGAVDLINQKYKDTIGVQTEAEKAANALENSIEDLQEAFGKLFLKMTPVIKGLAGAFSGFVNMGKSSADFQFDVNIAVTEKSKQEAIEDFRQLRDRYVKEGMSFEDATAKAAKAKLDVLRGISQTALQDGNYKQVLIYKAQFDAIKEVATADVEATKAALAEKSKLLEAARKKELEALRKQQTDVEKISIERQNKPGEIRTRMSNLTGDPENDLRVIQMQAENIDAILADIRDTAIQGFEDLLFSSIQSGIEQQIEALNNLNDHQNKLLDERLTKNKEAYDNELISARTFRENEKKLLDEKTKNEEKAQKRINELKKQAAIAAKFEKVFEIVISTAANIVKNPLLAAFYAALGATQTGIVLAQPLPKYHTGRLAKGYGEELAIIQKEETITDAKKSKSYAPVLEAIHYGRVPAMALNDFVRSFAVKDFSRGTSTIVIDPDKIGSSVGWNLRGQERLLKGILSELRNKERIDYRAMR